MSKSNMAWMESFSDKIAADEKTISEKSTLIIDALKGVNRVGCLYDILANVFEAIETSDGPSDEHGFGNQMVKWGLELYAGKKITKKISDLLMLHSYCVDKKYSESNAWEWGAGDRQVCYIENDKKKVLLFSNQNIEFVVVFEKTKLNVREVYRSIEDIGSFYYGNKSFSTTEELRDGLKTDKGLEIAISNITSEYSRIANSVEGNEYPDKIDLETMKKANFEKPCPSFRYQDNRDKGYLMSVDNFSFPYETKCELIDLNRADYAFSDMRNAISEIPKSYIKKYKRNDFIDDVLK